MTATRHTGDDMTKDDEPRGPVGRLLRRLHRALVADEEASLRYAAIDAELDGRYDDARRYAAAHDRLLGRGPR